MDEILAEVNCWRCTKNNLLFTFELEGVGGVVINGCMESKRDIQACFKHAFLEKVDLCIFSYYFNFIIIICILASLPFDLAYSIKVHYC